MITLQWKKEINNMDFKRVILWIRKQSPWRFFPKHLAAFGGDSLAASHNGKEVKRRVYINVPLPPHKLNRHGHPIIKYEPNQIRTSKYSILSFIPKNLAEQFRRVCDSQIDLYPSIPSIRFFFLSYNYSFNLFLLKNLLSIVIILLF